MSDSKEMMTLLKSIENVYNETVTEYILETFPNKEFLTAGKKNVFRSFVSYLFENIEKKYVDKALVVVNKIYKQLYNNNRTLDSYFTKDARSVLKKRFGEKSNEYSQSKKLLKISYKEKGQLIKENKEKVIKNNNNRIEFTSEEIFEIIQKAISSADPMYRMVALLMASGSRPIELFERSTFSKYKFDEENNWVKQNYVAKSKTKTELIKPIIYFNADKFIEELERAKTELKQKYPSFVSAKNELSSALTTRLNKSMKEIFKNKEKVVPYTARKIYGNISFELYKSKNPFGKNLSISAFLNHVLGHNENSLAVTHNYTNVDVQKENVSPKELAIKQDILEQKVDELETIVETEGCKKCESDGPKESSKESSVVKNKKEEKLKKNFKKVKEKYDELMKTRKKVTQTLLEETLNGVVPRSVVRLFYSRLD